MAALRGFGVVLEPLTPETAEIVRIWRNRADILRFMEYREAISSDQQQRWLESIQSERFAYYLIRYNGQPVGMIHLSHIDPVHRTAEAGIFIGEPSFSGTGTALGASILLLDHAFGALKLETIFAKVMNGNTSAEKYNQLLGFEKDQPLNDSFTRWQLTGEKFFAVRDKLIRLAG